MGGAMPGWPVPPAAPKCLSEIITMIEEEL
jgi:hypothetical protein